MFNIVQQTIQMPDGSTITLETGKLARQADGAVVLRSGKLMMLATVCAAKTHKEGTDFLLPMVRFRVPSKGEKVNYLTMRS
jgi:polyribonucleotide nucleotidyltransferase